MRQLPQIIISYAYIVSIITNKPNHPKHKEIKQKQIRETEPDKGKENRNVTETHRN